MHNQVDYASSELHDSTQRKEIFPPTKTYCSFNKNFAGLLILMQCINKLYLFLSVGCHPKSPGLSGITAPWFLEVGHLTLSGNQWGLSPMLDGIPDDEYAGQGSVWTAFDLRKSCVRQIEKGKALYRNLVEPCSTPLAIQDMASICTVSCLRFLRMSVWILRRYEVQGFWQYFLWMVSTDPIVVWDKYANSLSAWLFEVAHYVGGSRWSQSLVGLNHRIVVCGDTETFAAICSPQAGLQHIHCPFSVDDGEACSLAKSLPRSCEACEQWGLYHVYRCLGKEPLQHRSRGPALNLPGVGATNAILG